MSEEKNKTSLVKKVFVFSLLSAFLIMGVLSMKRAMPAHKEERIYLAIKEYSPYKLQKRIGGLEILDTRYDTKEKPSAAEVMLRLDEVEGIWGKSHLKIENSTVIVMDENKTKTIAKIEIKNKKERDFLKRFFGI